MRGGRAKPEHLAKGREHFLGVGLAGVGIRVVSRDRFVAKPHLIVTFHNCEAFDHLDPDDADYEKAVEPVVRQQDQFVPGFAPGALRLTPRDYPVAWTNRGDDAEVALTPESFRPNTQWTSDQDDYVLLAREAQASSVLVTWVLTEDGNDAATSGEFRVPTANLVDASDLFEAMFQRGLRTPLMLLQRGPCHTADCSSARATSRQPRQPPEWAGRLAQAASRPSRSRRGYLVCYIPGRRRSPARTRAKSPVSSSAQGSTSCFQGAARSVVSRCKRSARYARPSPCSTRTSRSAHSGSRAAGFRPGRHCP